MPDRRQFLQRAAVGAALFGVPLARAERAFGEEPPRLPPRELFATDAKRYWAELRRQWLLAADHVNLNCGSVGCTPLTVLNAMIDHLLSAEPFRDPANHVGYFHATYRDHPNPARGKDLVLLDTRGAEGCSDWSGQFVGTSFIFSDRAFLGTPALHRERAARLAGW